MGKRIAAWIICGLIAVIVCLWAFDWLTSGTVPKLSDPQKLEARRQWGLEQLRQQREKRDAAERREQYYRDAERQKELAQDTNAQSARSGPRRWNLVGTQVYLDGSGQVWSVTGGWAEAKELRPMVEEAVRTGVRHLRGGRVLLTDSRGRVWCALGSIVKQPLIYDAGQWHELPPLPAPGGGTFDPEVQSRISFHPAAWEDSAGNVYLGAKPLKNWLLYRCSPSGQWDLLMELPTECEVFDEDPEFAEQAGGRIMIYPTAKGVNLDWPVPYFDGQQWSLLEPKVCPNHGPDGIVPLGNGSIATICGHGRLWFYWPEGLEPRFEGRSVDEWAAMVDDLDPVRRERAQGTLAGVGLQMLPRLRAEAEAAATEESRQRMSETIDAMVASTEEHRMGLWLDAGQIHDGYIQAWWVRDGRLTVYVESLEEGDTAWPAEIEAGSASAEDEQASGKEERIRSAAFVSFHDDGRWTIRAAPLAQWRQAGLPGTGTRGWVQDGLGRLWCGDGFRLREDLTAERVAPEGLKIGKLVCARDGAVFAESSSWYLFDPAGEEIAPDGMPEQAFAIDGRFAADVTARVAWTNLRTTGFYPLLRIGPGPEPQVIKWPEIHAMGSLSMSFAGGVAVRLAELDEQHNTVALYTYVWDGERWHRADGDYGIDVAYTTLAMKMPDVLARIAGRSIRDRVFAAPGDGTLWFNAVLLWTVGNDKPHLQYYDGKVWHDVWTEVGHVEAIESSRVIELADHGRTILAQCLHCRAVYAVSFDGRKFTQKKFPDSSDRFALGGIGPTLQAPDGSVWMNFQDTRLLHYHDGQLDEVHPNRRLLLVDASGRVWTHYETVNVLVGDRWIDSEVNAGKLVEGPDGRIWSLGEATVAELVMVQDEQVSVVRQAGTYPWRTLRNQFDDAFIDTADGLWLNTSVHKAIRVQLPPATQPAS
jgi:hypothetical protein